MVDTDNYSPFEPITRYIFSTKHYSSEKQEVKYGAFIPPKDNAEISVFRIEKLNNKQIWYLAIHFVLPKRNRPLHGRGDVVVSDIQDSHLQFVPDPNTHPRHANITSWPPIRSEQKLIAAALAMKASLHLYQQDN